MSTLILGTIGIDDIETPVETARGVLGGSAGYAAVASSLYAPSRLLSIVGEDFTDIHRETFTRRNVDLTGLYSVPGKTFSWGGRYEINFDNRETLFTHLNSLAQFDPVLPKTYEDTKFVLLGNTDPQHQLKVLDQLTKPEIVIVDTMNLWLETQREAVDKVLASADIVVVNEEEARLISRHHNVLRSAIDILEMGPKAVIVKQGSYGALLRTPNNWFFTPAYPMLDVRDPTGAGDSFAGALTGYLAQQGELTDHVLRRAVIHGTVAASFAVEGFGLESLVTITEPKVEYRCSELMRFSQVALDID